MFTLDGLLTEIFKQELMKLVISIVLILDSFTLANLQVKNATKLST